MAKQRSIAQARSTLSQLVREVEAGEAVEVTRRGQGVAVLLGRQEYDRLAAGSRRFSEAWDEFANEVDVAGLDLDPDEIFADVRDEDPGRDSGL